jgi:dienelactone hydrolase
LPLAPVAASLDFPGGISIAARPGLCSPCPVSEPAPTSNATRWLDSVDVPGFAPPAEPGAWAARRAEIRATLVRLLGAFPPRPAAPAVEVLSRTEHDGYVLEKIRFENGIGSTVSGYLFLPAGRARRAPGILYCHWHAGQWDVGKEELLRTNATPVAPGPALARLGFAVLGIDACGFGERNGQGPGGPQERDGAGELTASKFNLWAGRTLWGAILRDDQMALDYLAGRPEVDPQRIGVTGISMGSTRSWWLMALDDRLKTAVCVACLTRYQDLIRAEALKEHGIYYFVPGMLRHFDTEAVIACGAPRPMLFMTGDRDPGSPLPGIRAIEERVAPLFNREGSRKAFVSLVFPDTGHVYLPEMWARMTSWMEQALQGVGEGGGARAANLGAG